MKSLHKRSLSSLAAVLLGCGSVHALESTSNQQFAQSSDERAGDKDSRKNGGGIKVGGGASEALSKGDTEREPSEAGKRTGGRDEERGTRPPRAKIDVGKERPARAESNVQKDDKESRERAGRQDRDSDARPVQREKSEPVPRKAKEAPAPSEKTANPAVEAPAAEVPPASSVTPKDGAPANARRKTEGKRLGGKKLEEGATPEKEKPSTSSAPALEAPDGSARKEGANTPPKSNRKKAGAASPPPAPSEVKDIKALKAKRIERKENGGKRIVIEEPDKRVIIKQGIKSIIRADERDRFRRLGGATRSEKRDGVNISVYIRAGGIEIFTETDDRGRSLRRYRLDRSGREIVLFDNRDYYRRHGDGPFLDAIIDLRPPRVTIPRNAYIVDYEGASDGDVFNALSAPPVEQIERAYSLEEVRRSPNLRDRMRRIDLDVINFRFGAWDISPDEYPALERIADAINQIIERNMTEMFLIEGHTDAVGSDDDNLSLSDRRAETVAIILTQEFGVPPENITTQGYGEHHLKIGTQQAEAQNRRVAVRRITPLISQVN